MNKSTRVDPFLIWMIGGGIVLILICNMLSEAGKSPQQHYNETVDHMADRLQYEAEQKKIQTQIENDAYIRSYGK